MARNLHHRKCRSRRSFISANKITPHVWRLLEADIIEALNAQGYDVKKIKKISYLKHQVSISYWDNNDGVCSGFFSYRIFARWQYAVQRLVYNCGSTKELKSLSDLIEYEYNHYPYPIEIQEAINNTIETCLFELGALESYKRNRYLETVGVC
jgi:hypothetical protein